MLSDEKKIQGHEDTIRMAYKLVRLDGMDDIPFPTLDSLRFSPIKYNTEESNIVESFFDKFELNSIKTRWINGTLWSKESELGKRIGSESN